MDVRPEREDDVVIPGALYRFNRDQFLYDYDPSKPFGRRLETFRDCSLAFESVALLLALDEDYYAYVLTKEGAGWTLLMNLV
jgi:hypothetical protein